MGGINHSHRPPVLHDVRGDDHGVGLGNGG